MLVMSKDNKSAASIIGPSVKVEGDFRATGNVLIEGIVHGGLSTDKDLRVGKDAEIVANVVAENAFIAGRIKGNVRITGRMELYSSAEIIGDVEVKVLSIEPGAVLNGYCRMLDKGEEAASEEPVIEEETVEEDRMEVIEEDPR